MVTTLDAGRQAYIGAAHPYFRRSQSPQKSGDMQQHIALCGTPSTAARDHQWPLLRNFAAPTPTADIISRPGYWKRIPPNKPPGMPFFTAPRAKDTWVDVGPGRQELREKSSRKTPSLIHFRFWIKVCVRDGHCRYAYTFAEKTKHAKDSCDKVCSIRPYTALVKSNMLFSKKAERLLHGISLVRVSNAKG
jgi:hypothetical protein